MQVFYPLSIPNKISSSVFREVGSHEHCRHQLLLARFTLNPLTMDGLTETCPLSCSGDCPHYIERNNSICPTSVLAETHLGPPHQLAHNWGQMASRRACTQLTFCNQRLDLLSVKMVQECSLKGGSWQRNRKMQ